MTSPATPQDTTNGAERDDLQTTTGRPSKSRSIPPAPLAYAPLGRVPDCFRTAEAHRNRPACIHRLHRAGKRHPPPTLAGRKMTGKLRLRNFQAIEDTTIDLEGLTVITGRSNLGKSALIRGIEAIVFGAPGDAYVRRGTEWAGGTLVLNDRSPDLKISWKKVPSSVRRPDQQPFLIINGQQYTKIGREHKGLTAPYGLIEIETSTGRLRPQVAKQHDPAFLVAENETTAAEVLKQLGRVDVVTEAQRLAKKDGKAADAKKEVRIQDQATAEARRDELNHVPRLREEFNETKTKTYLLLQERQRREKALSLIQEHKVQDPAEPPLVPAINIPTRSPVRDLIDARRNLDDIILPTPPKTVLPTNGERLSLLGQLRAILHETTKAEESNTAILEETEAVRKEKVILEQELGVCPTCQRSFNDHADHRDQDQGPDLL